MFWTVGRTQKEMIVTKTFSRQIVNPKLICRLISNERNQLLQLLFEKSVQKPN